MRKVIREAKDALKDRSEPDDAMMRKRAIWERANAELDRTEQTYKATAEALFRAERPKVTKSISTAPSFAEARARVRAAYTPGGALEENWRESFTPLVSKSYAFGATEVAGVGADLASDTVEAGLAGRSVQSVREAIRKRTQRLSQLPTEAERAAAAVRIFGRAGAELLPLFAQFAPNFSAARAEAERLGVSLSGLRTPEAFEALSGFGFDAGAIQSGKVSFDQIAQAIAIIPGEAERAAAAVAIFGAAGAELVPLFAAGASEIQAAREEAERFGLSLTNAQAGNIDTMGDSFDRARAAIQGVINQVVAYLAPAVTSVTTAFSDLIGNVGGANIGQAIGEGILQGARYFAEVADAFVAQATPVWNYVSQVGGQWSAVWDTASRTLRISSCPWWWGIEQR